MHKVVHCRSGQDVQDVIAAIEQAASAAAMAGSHPLGTNE
jgi:hypothetical protein